MPITEKNELCTVHSQVFLIPLEFWNREKQQFFKIRKHIAVLESWRKCPTGKFNLDRKFAPNKWKEVKTQSTTVANATSGASATEGQPSFLTVRLTPWNVPKLESVPFVLHINQVSVQAWESPRTSLLVGFGGLLSMSSALPQGGPTVTDFAKRWQLYRQSSLSKVLVTVNIQ